MPLQIPAGAPTLFIRRPAYERSGLARSALDQRLGLTDNEFRVEGDVVVIGPVFDADAFVSLIDDLERLGLVYYDDFFELSGSWPEWLAVFASVEGVRAGRSNPSQPHS
jgi:hypothetical protein